MVADGERVGVANSGYWGIMTEKDKTYRLSFYAKRDNEFNGPLTISLESEDGEEVMVTASIPELTTEWTRYVVDLTAVLGSSSSRLVLSGEHTGVIHLDMVSLMPETWKGRENGLRIDLAEKIQALEPKFLRFPGGCFVEGFTLDNTYKWKKTIGDIAERPGHMGMWNYYSSDGLGFHEFLQWSEDLDAEPLYVVNVGISHTLENAVGDYTTVPLTEIEPWIKDVLDAIEYANGPITSHYGSLRAKNGHPEPFALKYVEIGNENNFQLNEYKQRYPLFYDAIKSEYPEMTLISNAPLDGETVELIDEHYYNSSEWFIDHANMYDTYDRQGPQIYVGEYAVTNGAGKGNLNAAIGEAAFMTGMERNSDVVKMSSYAPLLVNDNDRAWNPDLIVFNNESSYGTPSYYVQQMFAQNTGKVTVPTTLESAGQPLEPKPIQGSIGLGSWNTQVEYDDVKVVSSNNDVLFSSDFSEKDADMKWSNVNGWWVQEYGIFAQQDLIPDARTVTGDANWRDYTLTLRAKKIGGTEGMLILFGVEDSDNYYWWNIGGWNNTQHAIEKAQSGAKAVLGQTIPGSIDLDRWYDIKIEIIGNVIRCYLDGELIHEMTDTTNSQPLLYSSSLNPDSGELIVKVVNVTSEEQHTEIQLKGFGSVDAQGDVTVLTADSLEDENSFEEPMRVAPKILLFSGVASVFDYTFPKNSVTILKLQTSK
jgi:alpha-L-arabinofuranosidase